MNEDFRNYLNDHLVVGGCGINANESEETKVSEPVDLNEECEEDITENETEVDEPVTTEPTNTFDCLVVMPTGSADVVLAEMQKRAEQDETIAKGLADNSKSIKGCIDYLCSQMKKFANKGCSSLMVSDEQVFGLAVHYYTESNEMLGISKTASSKPKAEKKDKVIPLNPKPTPKKEKKESLELSLF